MKVIEGDLLIAWMGLRKLPELQDVHIEGSFSCTGNKLTSLNGCPNTIAGNFSCTINYLESLDGCPEKVSGNFNCSTNRVKFTEEQVRAVCKVGGKVYC
jgi:hypothetical protein